VPVRDVHMQAQLRGIADDHDTAADRRQPGAQAGLIDGAAGDQALGAVAVRARHAVCAVSMRLGVSVASEIRVVAEIDRRRQSGLQRLGHPFEQQQQAERTGILDPGRAHFLPRAARIDHRLARVDQQARHQLRKIRVGGELLRRNCDGDIAHHRQHGTFDRVLQGLPGRLFGRGQRAREVRQIDACPTRQCRGQALQPGGEDRTGIAARAIEGGIGGDGKQLAGMARRHRSDSLGNDAERERKIRSGIAIGYRKDIEAVEVPALGGQPGDTGQHQALQPAAIQIGDARWPLAAHLRSSMKR
jgi:hypothetical protein